MSTTVLDRPTVAPIVVPAPVEETSKTPDFIRCCIDACDNPGTHECYFCEKPLCCLHIEELEHWCQFHFGACPDCYAKKQSGEL